MLNPIPAKIEYKIKECFIYFYPSDPALLHGSKYKPFAFRVYKCYNLSG
jgi:hypothetical protein